MTVLVDSSLWIDFLRGREEGRAEIPRLMREGRAAICPVVWLELWSGARGKREQAALREMRGLCLFLAMDDGAWLLAADLMRTAIREGLNCPLADVLIVACAKFHGAELLHKDKHMDALLALPVSLNQA